MAAWLPATAETVATVASRGQSIRVLVDKPAGKAIGSVVLLAGGHGRLDISADGKLGWGAGNQLVRTRADYAKAGYVAIVPDLAGDMKTGSGVRSGYRWSKEQADDTGAVIAFARGLAAPVYLVATSRGTLTATKTAVVTSGAGATRADAVVITSGMFMKTDAKHPSAQANVPGLGKITQPVLLLHHVKDGCAYTPASGPAAFKRLLSGAKTVDIKLMDGGEAGSGDVCGGKSHHGFLGQDGDVVALITAWLKALPR